MRFKGWKALSKKNDNPTAAAPHQMPERNFLWLQAMGYESYW